MIGVRQHEGGDDFQLAVFHFHPVCILLFQVCFLYTTYGWIYFEIHSDNVCLLTRVFCVFVFSEVFPPLNLLLVLGLTHVDIFPHFLCDFFLIVGLDLYLRNSLNPWVKVGFFRRYLGICVSFARVS